MFFTCGLKNSSRLTRPQSISAQTCARSGIYLRDQKQRKLKVLTAGILM